MAETITEMQLTVPPVTSSSASSSIPAAAASTPGGQAERVARAYFLAIGAHDVEKAVGMWEPGGREHVRGQVDAIAPDGVREFLASLVRAVPDLRLDVVATTAEGDRCAVQWRMTGTFAGPDSYNGIAPTGSPIVLEGVDVLSVRAGRIHHNDAFTDSMTFANQVGLLPPRGSAVERRLIAAFNAKTKIGQRITGGDMRPVADGVWVVQGQPGRCNVYLLTDGDGVTMFDAGARTMARAVATAAASLGGLTRIVLGHGHTDHRGSAPAFSVPVLCHPDEVLDAQGSGGFRYWGEGLPRLAPPLRQVHRALHRYCWDGGPVQITGTLTEGDDVAGFEVVHIPGHAPGQIALWRASDRLALTTDAFYTIDNWGRDVPAHVPEEAYNLDTAQARESLRKLAELRPAAAWPGHAQPVLGDVRDTLLRAADRR